MVGTPTVELDARFSSPGATPRPWSEVVEVLERSEIFWISTVRRDGRPHVTPLPAMWLDDALHFCTGPEEQKARNLAANPQVALTTGGSAYRSGLDVVDGAFRERLPAPSDEDRAPGTALVFAVAPDKVLAFGKGEPFTQTRYRF